MIVKQCQFSGRDDHGVYVHLVHPGYSNDQLIKNAAASPPQLEQIQRFLKSMSRADGMLYTLVSALGAGEFWGSNSNADWFGMDALLHVPPDWDMMPADQQKLMGQRWQWGYPTFYNAYAYQHHVNKDPARAFGTVEYVLWDPRMKRVLLIVGISRQKAQQLGAQGVVDRIENGEYPDVSMGCKVPFDVCSICGEMDFIRPFLGKPNEIVRLHKQRPIRGISTTTNEYCQHLKFELNKIYPDGQRVMMLNIHPRFFDISFVFIGADKTSKMLAKLAAGQCPIRLNAPICKHGCTQCNPQGVVPSAHVYNVWSREKVASDPVEEILMGTPIEKMTYEDRFVTTLEAPAVTKTAAMSDELIKEAYGLEEFEEDPAETARISDYFRRKVGGGRLVKKSEIAKRVSSHFGKHAPAIERSEPDIPHEVQDEMAEDLPHALSSAGGMGIVVKPREFQRMMLISSGNGRLADDLDHRGMMFRPGAPMDRSFGIADSVVPRILAALMPMLHQRSSFGPALHKRITIVIQSPGEGHGCDMGHMRHMGGDLMDKISSAYTSYRRGLIYKTASLIPQALHEKPEILNHLFGGDLIRSFGGGLVKEGGDVMESLIGGMLPVIYLNQAHFGGPVSKYVQEHLDLRGLTNAGGLAAFGGLA